MAHTSPALERANAAPTGEEAARELAPPAQRHAPLAPIPGVGDLLGVARERMLLVLATTLLGVLMGLALTQLLQRPYEASTRLMIDPRGLQVVDKDVMPRTVVIDQNLTVVESEMRVLTSDRVLRAVIDRMRLIDDPDFNGTPTGWLRIMLADLVGRIKALLPARAAAESEPPEIGVLSGLKRAVVVRREPQSFVVDLAVRAPDPQKARQLADAIAEEYGQTRFSVQSETMRRAAERLQGLLDEQRKRLEAAEARAERFRAGNDMVGVQGRLISEQQLSEATSRLVVVQSETEQARARYEQLKRLRQSKGLGEASSEALGSPTLVELRNQQAAIQRREAALQASLLPSHPAFKQVQRELQGVQRQIGEELGRLADGARLVLERANASEAAVRKSIEQQKAQALALNARQLELRELEREVEASRSVYAAYLARSREVADQRQVDSTLTVVLSPAIAPQSPSGLPRSILLLATTLAGLGLGLGAALLRDTLDGRVRSARHVRKIVGDAEIVTLGGLARIERGLERTAQTAPPPLPLFVADRPKQTASREVRAVAEVMRRRNAGSFPAVVVLTSAADVPWRPAIAANLALAFSALGEQTLLIDSDLEQRRLSRALEADGAGGLLDLLAGPKFGAEAQPLAVQGLSILPAGSRRGGSAAFDGAGVAAALARTAAGRDVVVVDAATLQSESVMAAWAPNASLVAVVVEAGATRRDELARAVQRLPEGRRTRWMVILLEPNRS